MALSNWDMLAFGVDGQPCEGWLENPSGNVRIEIFKNKIRVHKDAVIIATVFNGEVEIERFRIEAVRYEPQDAVFCFAHYCEFDGSRPINLHMAGIGCSGFMEEIDWLRANHPEEHARISAQIEAMDGQQIDGACEENGVLEFSIRIPSGLGYRFECISTSPSIKAPTAEDLWTGVLPSTVVAFRSWLTTIVEPDSPWISDSLKQWYRLVQATTPLRFNQGSAYLHQALGTLVDLSEVRES